MRIQKRDSVIAIGACAFLLMGGAFVWGARGQNNAATVSKTATVQRICGPVEAAKKGKRWMKGWVGTLSPKGLFVQGGGYTGRDLSSENDDGNFWTWSEKTGFVWGAVINKKKFNPKTHPGLFGINPDRQKRADDWNKRFGFRDEKRKTGGYTALSARANSVSLDGKVAVGEWGIEESEIGSEAFVWREDTGFRMLLDVAPIPATIETKNRYYYWQPEVSDDGTTIVTGLEEIWRIHDPNRFGPAKPH